jgi:mutator protein MutT
MPSLVSELYRHCPRCGSPATAVGIVFDCRACGLHLYVNPAIAVVGIILDSRDRVLLIRRAREPGKGKLAFPGGFVDPDETAEAALRRELQEEVNLAIGSLRYLCSQPNRYEFREVTYTVLDFFFIVRAEQTASAAAPNEVESLTWMDPPAVELETLAFSSMREAWKKFLARRSGRSDRI